MKHTLAVALLCVAAVFSSQAKEVPKDVQEALIALD